MRRWLSVGAVLVGCSGKATREPVPAVPPTADDATLGWSVEIAAPHAVKRYEFRRDEAPGVIAVAKDGSFFTVTPIDDGVAVQRYAADGAKLWSSIWQGRITVHGADTGGDALWIAATFSGPIRVGSTEADASTRTGLLVVRTAPTGAVVASALTDADWGRFPRVFSREDGGAVVITKRTDLAAPHTAATDSEEAVWFGAFAQDARLTWAQRVPGLSQEPQAAAHSTGVACAAVTPPVDGARIVAGGRSLDVPVGTRDRVFVCTDAVGHVIELSLLADQADYFHPLPRSGNVLVGTRGADVWLEVLGSELTITSKCPVEFDLLRLGDPCMVGQKIMPTDPVSHQPCQCHGTLLTVRAVGALADDVLVTVRADADITVNGEVVPVVERSDVLLRITPKTHKVMVTPVPGCEREAVAFTGDRMVQDCQLESGTQVTVTSFAGP